MRALYFNKPYKRRIYKSACQRIFFPELAPLHNQQKWLLTMTVTLSFKVPSAQSQDLPVTQQLHSTEEATARLIKLIKTSASS